MEEPIRKLGPYTLTSELGRGAFGVVWLAEKQTAIATTRVALKLPHSKNIDLEALKQEATIWIQASGHPNVLPLIDADIYDEQVVIVSEYVPDGSLSKWLNQHGGRAPSIEAACEMIDGILAGLAHLHGRRIIHRDLKPDNILLQGDTPRLADFGISRLLISGSHSMTVGGTPAYMAPEAFQFKRNERTDIWAVGIIFYQLLVGRRPYDQRDIDLLMEAITQRDPPPLPESVPENVQDIAMKALQRDPEQRYETAAQMRHDLREAKHKLWLGGQKTFIQQVAPAPTPESAEPQPPAPAAIPKPPAVMVLQNIPVNEKSRRRLWLASVFVALLLGTALVIGLYFKSPSYKFKQNLTGHTNSVNPVAHTNSVNSVAFSPDRKMLASGSWDNAINLWNVQTGQLKQTLTGHIDPVLSVAFSPGGQTLASGSWDKTIKLWDVQTGELKHNLIGHMGEVSSVAFSPDGQMLASGSWDKTIKLWDVQTGQLKQTLAVDGSAIFSVAFSLDGNILVSGSADETVKLWDVPTGQLKRILPGHIEPVLSVAFSPDGQTLASGSRDNTIKLWDVQTFALKHNLIGHSYQINSVAFSPDGQMLASGSRDNTIKLWDVQTGELKQTLTGHNSEVNSVAFSPDGKTLARGSADGTVKLWQVE